MFNRLLNREINAEIIATLLFIVLSGLYIINAHGLSKLIDTLFLWMFPASIMVFLTLVLVKAIEFFHERRTKGHKYVDWRGN